MSRYENDGPTLAEQLADEEEARKAGLSVVALRMSRATPDRLLRDIVGDSTARGPKPEPSTPVRRGTGWVEPRPLGSMPHSELIDRIVEAQVGGPNDTSKLK